MMNKKIRCCYNNVVKATIKALRMNTGCCSFMMMRGNHIFMVG